MREGDRITQEKEVWREIAQKRVSPQSPSHVGKEGWGLLGASWGKRCSLREGASPFFPHLPGSHSPSPNDRVLDGRPGATRTGDTGLLPTPGSGSSAPAQPPAALTLPEKWQVPGPESSVTGVVRGAAAAGAAGPLRSGQPHNHKRSRSE